MKEATGELSMTVVVIIAVIALIAILTFFFGKDGLAKTWINDQWTKMTKKADEQY